MNDTVKQLHQFDVFLIDFIRIKESKKKCRYRRMKKNEHFIYECHELLERLSFFQYDLSSQGELKEVFRLCHTLKALYLAMGDEKMAQEFHLLENLLFPFYFSKKNHCQKQDLLEIKTSLASLFDGLMGQRPS